MNSVGKLINFNNDSREALPQITAVMEEDKNYVSIDKDYVSKWFFKTRPCSDGY